MKRKGKRKPPAFSLTTKSTAFPVPPTCSQKKVSQSAGNSTFKAKRTPGSKPIPKRRGHWAQKDLRLLRREKKRSEGRRWGKILKSWSSNTRREVSISSIAMAQMVILQNQNPPLKLIQSQNQNQSLSQRARATTIATGKRIKALMKIFTINQLPYSICNIPIILSVSIRNGFKPKPDTMLKSNNLDGMDMRSSVWFLSRIINAKNPEQVTPLNTQKGKAWAMLLPIKKILLSIIFWMNRQIGPMGKKSKSYTSMVLKVIAAQRMEILNLKSSRVGKMATQSRKKMGKVLIKNRERGRVLQRMVHPALR